MNSFSSCMVILSLFAFTNAGSIHRQIIFGYCYDIKTSVSLDYTKLSTGTWFEISRYSNEFEESSDCAQQSFIPDGAGKFTLGFNVRFNNGSQGLLQGNVNYTLTTNETLLDATFPGQSSKTAYDILATDYTSFAITYACVQTSEGSLPVKNEQLWVLGREQQLSAEAEKLVDDALIYNGDSLGAYLDDVNQANC